MSKEIKTTWESQGIEYEFTWIEDEKVDSYLPCTQAYGICFNSQKEILLINNKGMVMIPGGTPENDETPVEALMRELVEEADITVSKVIPIGVQRVKKTNRPEEPEYYQYRFACIIDKVLPQTPDPDNGIIHPRFFVPAEEVKQHVKWGITGDSMFDKAIAVFEELNS